MRDIEAVLIRAWPTPRTTGLDGGSNSRKAAKKRGMWPTPTTRDHKGCGKNGRIRNGEIQTDTLNQTVWSEEPGPNSGQLNPTWVEWLMGFPSEWTVCEDSETPSCHKSQNGSAGES